MIRYTVEQEVEAEVFPEPFARAIKILADPERLGTRNLWLATDEIPPGSSSNLHAHQNEEVYFFLSGRGCVRVDDHEIPVEPGYCAFAPIGSSHQVSNDGDSILRFVIAVAPPFARETFESSHRGPDKQPAETRNEQDQKMLKYIVEQQAEGDVFPEPHARTIKPLAAPWTLGTRNIWLATDEIQPGNSSNPHTHDDKEEVVFFLSGKGRVSIDGEEMNVGPGHCVLFPVGSVHAVINEEDSVLRFIAVVAPPLPRTKSKSGSQ